MSDVQWFYADTSGVQHGPVSTSFLQGAISTGSLRPGDLVWREGMAEWMRIADVSELEVRQPARAATSPPPPPGALPLHTVVYAGFWRRYFALFLDQLIVALPVLVLVVAITLAIGAGSEAQRAAGPLFYLVLWVVAPLYYALQESSVHQATLGKRALGIKVTDLDGGRLSFGNALGRWFATLLSYLTLYIGFFMAGFTQRRQALHDMVAGTLVVDRWAYTPFPERQKNGLSGCLVALLVGVVVMVPLAGILAAIAIPAYQDYVVRADVSGALANAAPAKLAITEVLSTQAERGEQAHCPTNEEAGLKDAGRYADSNTRTIVVGTLQNAHCGIEITLGTDKPQLQGKRIWLDLDSASNGSWTCSSEIPDKYLPSNCRG